MGKQKSKMSSIYSLCANFWEEHKKQHLDASVSSSGSPSAQRGRWPCQLLKKRGNLKTLQSLTSPTRKWETKMKFKEPKVPEASSCHSILSIAQKNQRRGSWLVLCCKETRKDVEQHCSRWQAALWQKAAKLKEKYEKDSAAYRTKGG